MTGLPKGWYSCQLAECLSILDSQRKPVNNKERSIRIEGKDSTALFPYYGATGQVGFIDDYLFDEELIALGEDGVPFFDTFKNKAYMLKGKTWVNNHAHVLKGLDEINNRYICYYLNQFDYHGYVNGATRLKLTQANMRKIPILLAPLSEQIRITNKLDSLLGKLEATQKSLDKIPTLLKRFRESVLATAVSGELTAEWRKERGLNCKLKKEKLVDIVNNIQIGPFGSLLHKSDYIHGGTPIINPMHIVSGNILPSDNMTVLKEKYNELSRYHLEKGDVILGRRGEMGRAAVITKKQEGWLCGTGSLFLRFDHQILDPGFLWLVMTSPTTIADLIKNSVGTTMVNLNQKILKNLEISFPEIEEQKQIVKQAESLFNLADKVEQQYQAAKICTDKLTQSILAKAFRGELVQQDPNDEPASELLKRIQLLRDSEKSTINPKFKRASY